MQFVWVEGVYGNPWINSSKNTKPFLILGILFKVGIIHFLNMLTPFKVFIGLYILVIYIIGFRCDLLNNYDFLADSDCLKWCWVQYVLWTIFVTLLHMYHWCRDFFYLKIMRKSCNYTYFIQIFSPPSLFLTKDSLKSNCFSHDINIFLDEVWE